MRITGIVVLVLALTGSDRISCEAAGAQNGAAMVRGSWITEGSGAHYMYLFAVQDDRISGVVCTRCFDLDNLAFVSDGRVKGDALSFTLLHDRGDGKPYRETFRGKVVGDRITLTASRDGNPGQSLAVT